MCVSVWERDSACPSHGNPALLIKSARAARVWGRCWPHNAHTHIDTHSQTNTHARTHTETEGPTLGQRQACDVRPEDRCGQTSPSSALLLLLLLGNTQQMAEAQPPFSLPLSHFLLFLFPFTFKFILPPRSIHPFTLPSYLSLPTRVAVKCWMDGWAT